MGGSGVDLDTTDFPQVVGEYNFLVVWRLCLPEWVFAWLQYGPFAHPRFRVRSSDKLFDLGEDLCRQAAKNEASFDEDPSIYKLFTDVDAKYPTQTWTEPELGAEMAGQGMFDTIIQCLRRLADLDVCSACGNRDDIVSTRIHLLRAGEEPEPPTRPL